MTALRRALPAAVVAAALALAACAAALPRPIAYDEDACAFCRMTVADPRYGAEAVTLKGKVHAFDSVECLASYVLANRAEVRSAWVTDAERPGTLLPVDGARFTRSLTEAGSPMGLGLRAGREGALSWTDVLALVRERGFPRAGVAVLPS